MKFTKIVLAFKYYKADFNNSSQHSLNQMWEDFIFVNATSFIASKYIRRSDKTEKAHYIFSIFNHSGDFIDEPVTKDQFELSEPKFVLQYAVKGDIPLFEYKHVLNEYNNVLAKDVLF